MDKHGIVEHGGNFGGTCNEDPRKMALKDWRGKALTYLELEARTNRLGRFCIGN